VPDRIDTYMSDLLDALERHTQATQANTAAVNSLLGREKATRVPGRDTPDPLQRAVLVGQLEALGQDVGELLERSQVIVDRLALLRNSLTIGQTPAPAGSTSEAFP
jgi:hypothetical protein